MPAEKSLGVEAERTSLIMLLAISVVPEVTVLVTMPNADQRGFGVEWRVFNAVPEPASVFLLGLGVAAVVRRKLKR